MKRYKFITIEKGGIGRYDIRNNKSGDLIGYLRSYQRWKKWVLEADGSAIWSTDCLRDIINFIENEIPK